jgi:hypothetical protein
MMLHSRSKEWLLITKSSRNKKAAMSSKYCIQTRGTSPIRVDSQSTRKVHFMELKEQHKKQ